MLKKLLLILILISTYSYSQGIRTDQIRGLRDSVETWADAVSVDTLKAIVSDTADVLRTEWEGDISAVQLDNLEDVSATAPNDSSLLQYDQNTGFWNAVDYSLTVSNIIGDSLDGYVVRDSNWVSGVNTIETSITRLNSGIGGSFNGFKLSVVGDESSSPRLQFLLDSQGSTSQIMMSPVDIELTIGSNKLDIQNDRFHISYTNNIWVGAGATFYELPAARGSVGQVLQQSTSGNVIWSNIAGGSGGLPPDFIYLDSTVTGQMTLHDDVIAQLGNADRGDITVSSSGTVYTIDPFTKNFVPVSSSTYDLGEWNKLWDSLYVGDAIMSGLAMSGNIVMGGQDVTGIRKLVFVEGANTLELVQNVSANRVITLQDGDGTLAFLSDISGVGVSDGDKGGIDVTSSGTVWTVDTNAVPTISIVDNAVTLAKFQQVPEFTILGKNTAGTGTLLSVPVNFWNLLTAPDLLTAQQELALEPGVDVQQQDADLDDLADGSLTGSKVGTGINADNITTGTVADVRIASTIARDAEITKATLAANGSISDGVITDGDDNLLVTEDDVYDFVDINKIDVDTTDFWLGKRHLFWSPLDTAIVAGWDTTYYSFTFRDTVLVEFMPLFKASKNGTIIKITGTTQASTVAFNIEKRGETTLGSAGTNVMGSELTADTDQQVQTTFSSASYTKDQELGIDVSAVGGIMRWFKVTIAVIE